MKNYTLPVRWSRKNSKPVPNIFESICFCCSFFTNRLSGKSFESLYKFYLYLCAKPASKIILFIKEFLHSNKRVQTMDTVQVIGIIAGVCTSISLLPQLIKTIKEKKDGEISYFMLGILLIGIGLWIWYGLLKKDYPIIVTNSISFLLNSLIIVFNLYYRKKG